MHPDARTHTLECMHVIICAFTQKLNSRASTHLCVQAPIGKTCICTPYSLRGWVHSSHTQGLWQDAYTYVYLGTSRVSLPQKRLGNGMVYLFFHVDPGSQKGLLMYLSLQRPELRTSQSRVSLGGVPGPRVSGRLRADESRQSVTLLVPLTTGLSILLCTPHHSTMPREMGDRGNCGQELPSK